MLNIGQRNVVPYVILKRWFRNHSYVANALFTTVLALE